MQTHYYKSRSLRLPTTKTAAKSRLLWVVLLVGAFLVWFWPAKTTVERQYNEISASLTGQQNVVASAEISQTKLNIPDWSLFSDGGIWSLVSRDARLSDKFTPTLSDAPLEHTGENMKVATAVVPKLRSMQTAAAKDGVRLMLSSAYRSTADQQAIYNSYLRSHGQAYVNNYVALPGTSEHQTGLAIDISSFSRECKAQAAQCSLDFNATAWLRNNAANFGFIQRYPAGKQSITGVAGEAWHYRYVGTELARLLTDNDLTLDEFVPQIAPGYAR